MMQTDKTNNLYKTCSYCNIEKETSLFSLRKSGKYGVSARCKDCDKEYNQNYYKNNKDKIINNVAKWASENINKRREYSNRWVSLNKEKSLAGNKRWRDENKEQMSNCRKNWVKNKLETDPVFAMKTRIRISICGSFKRFGYTKRSKTAQILGCDWDFFKLHIEKQFISGMNWNNREKWHLDHIIPLAVAKTEDDVIRLNHFTNLRPLWAEDNFKKSDNVETLL